MKILIILATLAISVLLNRAVRSMQAKPILELKSRARSGDIKSAKVYRLLSRYGLQVHIILMALSAFFVAVGLVIIAGGGSFLFESMLITAYLLTLAFFSYYGVSSINLASKSAELLEIVLKIFSPLVKIPSVFLCRYIQLGPSKSIHSKEELLQIISKAKADSALSPQEKKVIRGSLTYSDKKVSDVMVPIGVVDGIGEEEVLSPVVISELHANGHSRFPVYRDDSVVGTLLLKDAVNVKTNTKVSSVMRPEVYYLSEDQTLQDALKGFLKTKHHLFIVVNSYEDIVGIITIEDVIEEIIGQRIVDEFDQYDDIKVMAKSSARQKRQ